MKEEKAIRYYDGKPEWSLVDFDSLIPMVRVLEFGKKKYDRNNWQRGLRTTQICESMLRHIFAFLAGEDNDVESKLSHIGHIQTNAMFLSYMMKNKPQLDDRDGKQREKELQEREIVRNELFNRYAAEEAVKLHNAKITKHLMKETEISEGGLTNIMPSSIPPQNFVTNEAEQLTNIFNKYTATEEQCNVVIDAMKKGASKNSFDDIFKEAEMLENGFPPKGMGGHYVENLKDGNNDN